MKRRIDPTKFSKGLIYALGVNGVESFDRDNYAVGYALDLAKRKVRDFEIELADRISAEIFSDIGYGDLILGGGPDWNKSYLKISKEKSEEWFGRHLPGHSLDEFKEVASSFVSGLEEYAEKFSR